MNVCAAWRSLRIVSALVFVSGLTACQQSRQDASTVVMTLDNSPTNLDPRVGTDAMSERIGGLLFDALVQKDEHFRMQPWLATSWTQPDPLTWIFHLRPGVRFTNGQPLTAEDVAFTINSLVDGSLLTSKAGAFTNVLHAEAPDPATAVIHMRRPDASLLFNLSDGLFGVVPRGSGKDFGRHPIGSGPYRFLSATQDKDVLVERNPEYWAGPPHLQRIDFQVVPDAVTVALELEKGSADIASNQLTLDMVHALEHRPNLVTETAPGSPVMYLNFNVTRGPLSHVRVRQAIACAIDRRAIVHAVWRDQAQLAETLLPASHWAAGSPELLYAYDPGRARALLDADGFPPDAHGVRLHLEMKISTDETTRLLAEILQQQMRDAGIVLSLRSSEFGTFYSDVTAGRFEMYALRWIGSNEDPDIFHYAFGSDRMPPKGGNRGHYANPRLDQLLAAAANTLPGPAAEASRRQIFLEVQQTLSAELPALPLWYPKNEIVHTARLVNITPRMDGSFAFLREAILR